MADTKVVWSSSLCALSICHENIKVENVAGKHRLDYDMFPQQSCPVTQGYHWEECGIPIFKYLKGQLCAIIQVQGVYCGSLLPVCLSHVVGHLRDWATLRLLTRMFRIIPIIHQFPGEENPPQHPDWDSAASSWLGASWFSFIAETLSQECLGCIAANSRLNSAPILQPPPAPPLQWKERQKGTDCLHLLSLPSQGPSCGTTNSCPWEYEERTRPWIWDSRADADLL